MRFTFQPRKIEEIKDFLLTARRKDAKCEWSLGGAAGRVVPPLEPGVLLVLGCGVRDSWGRLC